MTTRKRTVITEETHEVWIIRQSDDTYESQSPDVSSASVEFELPTLALEPVDDDEK